MVIFFCLLGKTHSTKEVTNWLITAKRNVHHLLRIIKVPTKSYLPYPNKKSKNEVKLIPIILI